AELATEVEIISLDKDFPSGEMNITTQGIGRVKIFEFQTVAAGKLYPSSAIERLETTEEASPDLQEEVYELIDELHQLLGVEGKLPMTYEELKSFEIGHHVGMNLHQEYSLLTLEGEEERLKAIKQHIQKILPIVVEAERLKSRAKLNGHFKNLIPPHF
ncbi:MAG: peptidase, partial [Bacteroidota bacterium]